MELATWFSRAQKHSQNCAFRVQTGYVSGKRNTVWDRATNLPVGRWSHEVWFKRCFSEDFSKRCAALYAEGRNGFFTWLERIVDAVKHLALAFAVSEPWLSRTDHAPVTECLSYIDRQCKNNDGAADIFTQGWFKNVGSMVKCSAISTQVCAAALLIPSRLVGVACVYMAPLLTGRRMHCLCML